MESISGDLGKASETGNNSVSKVNGAQNLSNNKPLQRSNSAKGSTKKEEKKKSIQINANIKRIEDDVKKSQTIEASKVDPVNEKEARKAIEQLKLKQNHEMLVVLEEEQVKENQREQKMNTINDPQEKKRLEKIYAMERAKAHARIQTMAE